MNYLYNGVELPALPDYDTMAYPVAMASLSAEYEIYILTLLTATPTISGESIIWVDGPRVFYQCIDGVWEYQMEDTTDGLVTELKGDLATWTNTDILYADGTVYLAATEPVPVGWTGLKSWLIGFALGLAGKPLPLAVKTPVAYLYNGVRLPALPEWDRESYPYAAMTDYSANSEIFKVFASSEPLTIASDGYLTTAQAAFGYIIGGDLYGDKWTKMGNTSITFALPVWANYDVLNEDGALYLAASDPVPVYE